MSKAVSQRAPHVPSTEEAEPAETAHPALVLAGAIVGAEGLIGLGYGLYLLIAAFVGTPRELGQAIAVGVTFMIISAPVPFFARRLTRAKMSARTPSVMAQLLAYWLAYYMIQASDYALAVPTIVVGTVALTCIFLPSSTSALTKHWRED